jgi:hypothetical protein
MPGNTLTVTPIQQHQVTDPRLDTPVFLRFTPPETIITTENYITALSETLTTIVGKPKENKTVDQMETWKFLGWLQTTIKNDVGEHTALDNENKQHNPADIETRIRDEFSEMVKDPSEYSDLPDVIIEPTAYIELTVKAYETLAIRLHPNPDEKHQYNHVQTPNPFQLPETVTNPKQENQPSI